VIAHAPEPIAYGVAVGNLVPAYQLQKRAFPPQLPKVLQAPASCLKQENQAIDKR
jgi:hypothetical protein